MAVRAYSPLWLADLLHSFPHLDLTLRITNSTFQPLNGRYRESLVFWAALPVLWLLLTLLVFLMYFCYRCCQKDNDKKRQGSCLQWAMAILALFTCGAIGVGFYGNEDAHKGIQQFAVATEDADITIRHMETQVNNLHHIVNDTIDAAVYDLEGVIRSHHGSMNRSIQRELRRLTNSALRSSSNILTSVRTINKRAHQVNLQKISRYTKEYGYYRWVALIALMCWQLGLCLLLLLGIGKTSKCTLLVFCALGIFTLVLVWASAGLHLGASVGAADFCVSPNAYFERVGSPDLDHDIIEYYLTCNSKISNPFSRSLKSALDSVTSTNKTLRQAVDLAQTIIRRSEMNRQIQAILGGLEKTVHTIQQLTALVDCTNLNKDYSNGVRGICHQTLPGIVFLLLSSVATGLLLTVLVLMASCAWRHFSRRKGYCEVDEDDPFLPRPDNASPSYYSFTRGRHTNPREHTPGPGPVHRRSSPPPAYSTNEFYRQYNDVTPESRPSVGSESTA